MTGDAVAAPLPVNHLLAAGENRPRFAPPVIPDPGAPIILVIGAGFTGLSAVLHLAERRQAVGRAARIILLEADRVASGPSGKSGGHVCGLQASDAAVLRHCGVKLGKRLLAAAHDASDLVRDLITRHAIDCDLRDGSVLITADGRQVVTEGGTEFGIEGYPFAVALARAAAAHGVEIREGERVTALTPTPGGIQVTTTAGMLTATLVLAAGGHRMAEDIALLAPLRRRTTEIRVSTIITDPLPEVVLRRAMPQVGAKRFPFANDTPNVAYGSVGRDSRLIFGACATGWRDPDPGQIATEMHRLLPTLQSDFRAAAGRDLRWQPLVTAERLCVTRDRLPNVGIVPGQSAILYVQALGGHGVALGAYLGKAAAEKLWDLHCASTVPDRIFDAFAAVPHGWLPPGKPWRQLAAAWGLLIHRSKD